MAVDFGHRLQDVAASADRTANTTFGGELDILDCFLIEGIGHHQRDRLVVGADGDQREAGRCRLVHEIGGPFVNVYGSELQERQSEPVGDRRGEVFLVLRVARSEELDRRGPLGLAGIPCRLRFATLELADLHEESKQALVSDEASAYRRFPACESS